MREAGSKSELERYLSEISRYPVLTVDEEQALARRFRNDKHLRSGDALVTANLRFVVKVAYEYRSYGFRMADLVQEGNMGLLRAVQKFDPDRGVRLISYAVWWIRAFIQNYIVRSWSMVKLGTTRAQRKLFFAMARTRREIERLGPDHVDSALEVSEAIARRLQVMASEVRDMAQRMESRDVSLDAPVGEDGTASHVDVVPCDGPWQDEALGTAQEQRAVSSLVAAALGRLDIRERFLIEQRMMSEVPMTLQALGEHFGVSRERARQLEIRASKKLRVSLVDLAGEGSGAAEALSTLAPPLEPVRSPRRSRRGQKAALVRLMAAGAQSNQAWRDRPSPSVPSCGQDDESPTAATAGG